MIRHTNYKYFTIKGIILLLCYIIEWGVKERRMEYV